MLKNIIIQAYFFFSYLLGFGQSVEITNEVFLPEVLTETSGMLFYPPNRVVHINDSGNRPEILVTDTMGKLIQQYCLPGAINIDWEELAHDDKGHIYIGDFGNNQNRRKDLVIYKVEAEKVLQGDDSFIMSEIHFTYEDQTGFPPERDQRNFDMEAMIHVGDSLYLFSKNRTSPFNGYTYCYRLPDTPGNFVAEKLDSFKTGEGVKESFWIAGADYRKEEKTLLLLGYDKLWMFYYFKGNNFFRGKHNVLYFNTFTQKESISFSTGNRAFVTDEKNNKRDGKLYTMKLPAIMNTETIGVIEKDSLYHVEIVNTDIDSILQVKLSCPDRCTLKWEAFISGGQRLQYDETTIEPDQEGLQIDTADWQPGEYQLNAVIGGQPYSFRITKAAETP